MRPGYRPAFKAWQATDPAHNPNAPPGPAYMPQYVIPQDAAAKAHDARADTAFARGSEAGATADKYIRATVFLATVLFLVGISGHFRIPPSAHGPDRRGRIAAGFRGDPVARPSRTARVAALRRGRSESCPGRRTRLSSWTTSSSDSPNSQPLSLLAHNRGVRSGAYRSRWGPAGAIVGWWRRRVGLQASVFAPRRQRSRSLWLRLPGSAGCSRMRGWLVWTRVPGPT